MAENIKVEGDKIIVESTETITTSTTFSKSELELKIALCDQSILQAQQQLDQATADKDYFNSLLKNF